MAHELFLNLKVRHDASFITGKPYLCVKYARLFEAIEVLKIKQANI